MSHPLSHPMVSSIETSPLSLDRSLCAHRIAEAGHPYVENRAWTTDGDSVLAEGLLEELSLVLHLRHGSGSGLIANLGDSLIWLQLNDGTLIAMVAGPSRERLLEVFVILEKYFPRPEMTEDKRIALNLWVLTPNGPRRIRRKIDVPSWSDISFNYSAAAREELQDLMKVRPQGGQIVLWHGRPGTGKTYALRALGWEWRRWCDVHYVVDPDAMFGQEPAYLMEVILDEDEGQVLVSPGDGSPSPPVSSESRWKLLVLEDTGEMLTPDAKEHVGQGLSRLLNVADGLIGQGLRLLILITTNEEVQRLHPAVSRPGRSALQVAFGELSHAEAKAWLEQQGADADVPPVRTVAELYAAAEGWKTRHRERNVVGFGRAS